MNKNILVISFCLLSIGFILAQEDMIDTGFARESSNPVATEVVTTSTEIAVTPTEVIQKQKEISTLTQESKEPVANPSSVSEEKVEVDTEAKDTEGIIILSPGEVEPAILEKYVKYEKPSEEKVEEGTEIIKKEKEEVKEGGEVTFEYKEEEAEIVLIEGEQKEKIEKAGLVLLEKAGFISQSFIEDGIIFNPEKNFPLLPGKFVFVNITVGKPVKKGDKFIVYDDGEEVFNPKTDEYVGKMINVKGIIKINKKVKDNIYNAKIVKSYGMIKDGYKVKLRKEISDYHNKITRKEVKKLLDVEGFIIKAKNKDKELILNIKDIVYIDKGLEHGILPGIKMDIIKPGQEESENEKINVIGKILVINCMKNNSTAILVSQNDIVKVGDIVRTIKK